jgi:tetratricopeptide (TPR) repeat protein
MMNDTPVSDRFKRAVGYKVDGRYEEALDELRAFIGECPDDPEARHQYGLILGFMGEFEPSLHELVTAVELSPENSLIRNDLALTYTMLGMYEEAKEQFALVLQKDRQNSTALRNLTYF